jgi:hypothetical protein
LLHERLHDLQHTTSRSHANGRQAGEQAQQQLRGLALAPGQRRFQPLRRLRYDAGHHGLLLGMQHACGRGGQRQGVTQVCVAALRRALTCCT